MFDWTVFSPAYLTALVEWAGAVVTLRAVDSAHTANEIDGEQR